MIDVPKNWFLICLKWKIEIKGPLHMEKIIPMWTWSELLVFNSVVKKYLLLDLGDANCWKVDKIQTGALVHAGYGI